MGTNRRYGSDLTDKAINAVLLAWVRYPEWTVQVAGRVVAYNDRMVLVEWETQGGGTHQAWVWRSAVTMKSRP